MPTRRGFLARIGAAAIGLTLASKLPGIASAPPRLEKPDKPEIRIEGHGLTRGDVFTIAGMYALNPITGESTGMLKQFVVTSDVSAGPLSDEMFHPPIREHGPYATVEVRETDGVVRPWPWEQPHA